jgi:hypothetical protein
LWRTGARPSTNDHRGGRQRRRLREDVSAADADAQFAAGVGAVVGSGKSASSWAPVICFSALPESTLPVARLTLDWIESTSRTACRTKAKRRRDTLQEIRIYLKQQRAWGRDDFRAMVEAKARRFAGIGPAHRSPKRSCGK